MREKKIKTLIYSYLFQSTSYIFNLLFYLLIYKFLPTEEVGLYSWAMAVISFFAFFLDLGTNQTLIRAFARNMYSLKYALFLSIIRIIPVLLGGSVLLILFSSAQSLKIEIFLWLGLTQIIFFFEKLFQTWLRANERQITANILILIGSLLSLLLVAFYSWFLIWSIQTLVVGLFFVYLFRSIITGLITCSNFGDNYMTPSNFKKNIKRDLIELLKPCIIFSIIGLITIIQNRVDWLMVSAYISKTELANYSLANRIYEIFIMALGIYSITMYPWLCKDTNEVESIKYKILFKIILVCGITLSLTLAMYLPYFLTLIFKEKYQNANGMVSIIFIGGSFATIAQAGYYLAISKNMEKNVLWVSLIATVVQILSDILLIPRFKGNGAAIGMVFLNVTSAIGLSLLIYYRRMKEMFSLFKEGYNFLFIMLLIVSIIYLVRITPIIGIILIIISSILFSYFKYFSEEEKKYLLQRILTYKNNNGKII